MTKMRRTQAFALSARPYALAAFDLLKNLMVMTPAAKLPAILKERKIKNILLVVVTTDKGLVGGFNDAVIRKAEAFIARRQAEKVSYSVLTVGKKAKEYFDRKKIVAVKNFIGQGDFVNMAQTKEVADAVLDGFKTKKWDAVTVIYTHFKTTLKQETKERKLLPTREASLKEIIEEIIPEHGRYSELRKEQKARSLHYNYKYKFEPSAEKILDALASNLLRIALHHIMLESNASEHSSRMVTMKSASDNAGELTGKLTLSFNKARQAGITAELSEIVAGAEALQ